MGDELKRVVQMAREAVAARARGERAPDWTSDPHLRRGVLLAIPVFALGLPFIALFGLKPWVQHHDAIPFLLIGLPFSLAANAVWLGSAARSRARAGRQDTDRSRTP